VVATRVGGIPEIVRHGETGFLVERRDVRSLIACTDTLIGDAVLRKTLGRQGRRLVETEFSNPLHVERMQAIYDELLA
jgi:glycosyltransferase involved in cell wall biosynthesis